MNFVYLSPQFPPHFYRFCVELARQGVQVFGIGDAPLEQLRPELREALADYYQVNSLHDEDQVRRACGYFVWRHGKIDRIESHIEIWLTLEAVMREDFNMIGPKIPQTDIFRRKSKMKEVFRGAGIPVADGELFRDRAHTEAFIKRVGYPIIAKPDIGVGGQDTFRIEGSNDIDRFLSQKPSVDYFLEAFVFGDLFTFDGITDQQGNMVYHTSHTSATGVLELVVDNVDLSYYSLREIPETLRSYGEKSVAAFGIREKFFHFEFWKEHKTGRYIAMELNCRPPGGYTTDIMNYSADIDVYREWANVIVRNRFESGVKRKYHCAHVARRFEKSYRLSHEEILAQYGANIAFASEVPLIFAPVMGNMCYLVRSEEESEIRKMILAIQEKA
ncbi:MAG: carboxylate--amine ligase [Candidatus Riflebacteria bacterium]|nr:carboxylate--amine ligase [Candidatus Riflebacteria bacterium]